MKMRNRDGPWGTPEVTGLCLDATPHHCPIQQPHQKQRALYKFNLYFVLAWRFGARRMFHKLLKYYNVRAKLINQVCLPSTATILFKFYTFIWSGQYRSHNFKNCLLMSHNRNQTKGMTKAVIIHLLLMVQLSVLYHLSVHVFITVTVHPKSDLTKIYKQVQSFKRCFVQLYLQCKSIKRGVYPIHHVQRGCWEVIWLFL